jgi:hypothetical protein
VHTRSPHADSCNQNQYNIESSHSSGESGGYLSAIFTAANEPSTLSTSNIQLRNAEVDKQLRDSQLYTVDVRGDGNCFFRALSVSLYGNETHHEELRTSIGDHLLHNYVSIFELAAHMMPTDYESARQCADNIRRNETWVGEDAILTAADFLQRDILIYISAKNSPLIYSPASNSNVSSLPPIRAVFYEPGHYCSVVVMTSQNDVTSCSTTYEELIQNQIGVDDGGSKSIDKHVHENFGASAFENRPSSDVGKGSEIVTPYVAYPKPVQFPSDIAPTINSPLSRPILSQFPWRVYGKGKRRFQSQYYLSFTWLEYSIQLNAAYCFPCRFLSNIRSPFNHVAGFCDWNHATGLGYGFTAHK